MTIHFTAPRNLSPDELGRACEDFDLKICLRDIPDPEPTRYELVSDGPRSQLWDTETREPVSPLFYPAPVEQYRFTDFDHDGDLDLLYSTKAGMAVLLNEPTLGQTLYADGYLRIIDSALGLVQGDGECSAREGWVDYIVDEKDLRLYVGLNLDDKSSFFRKFPQGDKKKTETLWNAVKYVAQQTGNRDAVLTQEEIDPIRARAYTISWSSIFRNVERKGGFLEFPPELIPTHLAIYPQTEREKEFDRDGFVEGRHGLDIERLVAKNMEWRLANNGLPRETEVTTVIVKVGSIVTLSLDNLEEKNKSRPVERLSTHSNAVSIGLVTDAKIQHIQGIPWIESYRPWERVLFRIRGESSTVVAGIVQYYYDPDSRWEQSGPMVFKVPEGPQQYSALTIDPKKGVAQQRDSKGQTTWIKRSENSWAYDTFLLSHGLPFPLVHYQDQLPPVVEETTFQAGERWPETYRITLHNPAAPAEKVDLYFSKDSYRFFAYQSIGAAVSFFGTIYQDPATGIRYSSSDEPGSGILKIQREGADLSETISPAELQRLTTRGSAF